MILVEKQFTDMFKRKQKCLKLYEIFVKYYKEEKDLSLNDFISKVSKEIDEKLTISSINSYISIMQKEISSSKSEIMKDILKYYTDKKVSNALIDTKIKKQSIRYNGINNKFSDNLHREKMSKLLGEMNKIISDDRTYKQLVSDNEVENDHIFSDANKYIPDIDDETYLTFVIKYRGIEKLSIEELSQYKELLKYFISNLQKNAIKLSTLNDEVQIRNMHVKGEEELSEYYTDNITRLQNWKIKQIRALLEYYQTMYEMVEELIITKNIECIKKIKFDKKVMSKEEDFVEIYHENLQNISETLKYIKKLNNVTDARNKELCKKYNDKVIIENN